MKKYTDTKEIGGPLSAGQEELLSVGQAALYLNVSPGTIRRWAYLAQLNGKKIGQRGDWRFTKEDLEAIAVTNTLTPEGDTETRVNSEAVSIELNQEPTMLEAIVQFSDDAIISKTLDGIIRSWNKGAENIFGYTPEEAVGQHISLILPIDRLAEEAHIISRLRTGEIIEHFDTKRLTKDGRVVDISLTISPVKNKSGEIIGASKIGRDVTERKRQEAALRDEEQRKDDFIAVLAHELRNPLSPILSAAEILNLQENQSEHSREAVDIIHRQVRHMTRLIDDLLDVSRIKRNKFILKQERVDIAEVLRAALESTQTIIEQSGHTLVTTFAPQTIYVNGDHVRLSQVITNLLSNAARYSPPGETIWLEAQEVNNEVLISVRDSGIGIEAEVLPRIFEIFVQGNPGRSINAGLGVGLTLAKRLVELHGGTIKAHSLGLQQGSTFTVALPISVQNALDLAVQTPARAASVGSLRILIADDNKDALTTLSTMLRLRGNEVATASDGLEAVREVTRFNPDFVLLDIGMPNMNGYEAARLIRTNNHGKRIKLVAITGWGQAADKSRALEAGFDSHMTKPVDASALSQLLMDFAQHRDK